MSIQDQIADYQRPYVMAAKSIFYTCMATGKLEDLAAADIGDAPPLQDMLQATDFVINIDCSFNVGFRVREIKYFRGDWRYQFTVRSKSDVDFAMWWEDAVCLMDAPFPPSELIDTRFLPEYEKMLCGIHPHLSIYAFRDADKSIAHWIAYRPDVLRSAALNAYLEDGYGPRFIYSATPNNDSRGTHFRAVNYMLSTDINPRVVDLSGVPAGLIVAHSGFLDDYESDYRRKVNRQQSHAESAGYIELF